MASRGKGYRRGGRQFQPQYRPKYEDVIAKQIQQLNPVTETTNYRSPTSQENTDSTATTSAAAAPAASDEGFSQFPSDNRGGFNNRRNSRWRPRNRRAHVIRPRFADKTEVCCPSSGERKNEKEEKSRDGENLEGKACGGEVFVENGVVEEETEGSNLNKLHDEAEESNSNESKVNKLHEEAEGSNSNESQVDEVMKILEKLILSSDGTELPEEQLKVNDQRQEDELLAMESIYGNNILILERIKDLRSFQIYIHIETPREVTVSADLSSSGVLEKKDDESPEFLYSFEVKYLPPIVLTCALPKLYPSHFPPCFIIFAQWLNSAKISELCCMLDSIWKEQSGQEIIYQWVDWLQSSCLSFLGFEGGIILGPYGVRCDKDKRALSGIVSPHVDIPSMKSYNDKNILEKFLTDFHECGICFSEFVGTEFVRLPCLDFFCWNCMRTYADMLVKEGTVSKLHCPQAKCEGMIPPGLLKRLLDEEEFERWESMTLQKTLESMSDVTYCPRCETICIEDEDQHALCPKCFFSFCTLCRERRHIGVECMNPEMKLRILQERQHSSQLGDQQKHREKEIINELLSVREIHHSYKQCPSCKMFVSRTEGCNKMVCGNCQQYFCYVCLKPIDGYDHFRGGNCELFPVQEIQAWEERMNVRQVRGQLLAELHEGRGHECPNCRQLNVKVNNNNHIFCWACQNHYCYLCRKMVRRGTLHFGPKGCKQHTPG